MRARGRAHMEEGGARACGPQQLTFGKMNWPSDTAIAS